MKVLFGIWKLLDAWQRRRLVALQVLSLLMAFSTVGGIAAILPFFTVLADPGAIDRNEILQFLYSSAGFDDRRSFVVALGITFAVIVLLANAINLVGSLAMNRFAHQVGNAFHVSLFSEYMSRGYGFHARTSSSTLATNVLHETGRVTSGILQNSLILITSLITIAFIFTCIVLVNPLVAVSAVAGLGTGYLSIYVIARGRLLRNGALESRCFAQRAQMVSASFAAIKEISALQAQRLCIDKFSRYCASFAETLASTFTISQIPKHVLECATVFSLAGIALYLLAGLLVPDSGRIEVDGIVIDDDKRRSWQATIGYVPQQIFLIEGTLAENIALGLAAAQVDRTRVRMAAHLAQLDECVATLPNGYDTMLGERGSTLSGGQRQRLGIARALYRDASVLIMDEATSALDAAAEQEIGDMLMALRQNRTIILIAHRLSTLRYCDTIHQLEAGRIIRSGPYREFLSPLSALLLSEDENAGKVAGARGHP